MSKVACVIAVFWNPGFGHPAVKESAAHHICPLCSQHKEIAENEVKSGSLVTLNRLVSWFEIRGDLMSFERATSLEGLRGAPRSDPGVILR